MRAIIIDDETHCIESLTILLKKNCPEVSIVGVTTKAAEGIALVSAHQPDIVFLDVEMPVLNGFQVLEALSAQNFKVIFTTAYDVYAVKAIKYSALDYLLKPIDPDDLIRAIKKAEELEKRDPLQLDILKNKHGKIHDSLNDKIALPHRNGLSFTEVGEIVYCETADNYVQVTLKDGTKSFVMRTLSEVEDILEGQPFYRIHRQFLINLTHVKLLTKFEDNTVIMSNDDVITIARNKREEFQHLFKRL